MKDNGIIQIRGARENNLKNISIDIPRGKFVVVTGLSGSGKSSLVFDTLYAEGQRRFAESLSSYARQFLGRMSKPDVDSIEGIPPAIAIEQKVNIRNPRSTVATTTEIYDYLRIVFSRIGRIYSPITGKEIRIDTNETVCNAILSSGEEAAFILGDLHWENREDRTELLLSLKEQGYTRLFSDGKTLRIEEVMQNEDIAGKETFLLVDRIKLPAIPSSSFDCIDHIPGDQRTKNGMTDDNSSGSFDRIDHIPGDQRTKNGMTDDNSSGFEGSIELKTRLWASIQDAFDRGDGDIAIWFPGRKDGKSQRPTFQRFCNRLEADGIKFIRPDEYMLSFNSPIGACPTCGGLGKKDGISEDLVIPDKSLSIYDGAIAPFRGEKMGWFRQLMCRNGHKYGLDVFKPYCKLSDKEKNIVWKGIKAETEEESIIGIDEFFQWVETQKYKIQYKYMLSRFSGRAICPDCAGTRLRKESLWIRVGGKNIAEVMEMTVQECKQFLTELKLDSHDRSIAGKAIEEILSRLDCLLDVGLQYLTLSRPSNTLSGGESQRINLVTALGSSLVGSLYILDEPSIGLHSRDTERLIFVLKRLRDIGNTVVVVEHDADIMRAADMIIDLGPGAGENGGEAVYQGTINGENGGKSLTLRYLTGKNKIYTRTKITPRHFITIEGAQEHNLKDVDVRIPLGCLAAVTGVSGSGKSTVVGDILFPALKRRFEQAGPIPGTHRKLSGDLDKISQVEFVDQNPIGRSSRSNPVTYLKIYDDIRLLLSSQQYAKISGYTPSFFSFNQDGGRCPECQGEGVVRIPMQFMSDVTMVCEQCGGKRFKADILQVRYRGKNVDDILSMSVDEAIEFFSQDSDNVAKSVAAKLQNLSDVGLGYVKLGQSSSTLSGGESQRIKLAYFLSISSKSRNSGKILFIFDEPTTGLHFKDVETLLHCFDRLISHGHSVLAVEHNLDVIKAADYIIDLGPDAGDNGGRIIYEGVPENIPATSSTGKYLRKALRT